MSGGTTPNPADLLSRYLVGTFDEKKVISVSTGFMAFFGNLANGSETLFSPDANQVDIDIIRGSEKIAALVPRGTVSRSIGSAQKNLRPERFTEISRKFPLIEEEGDMDSSTLLNRVAGETPYQRQTRMTRLRAQAIKITQESMRRTIRTHEVLAASSVLNGMMPAILGTTDTNLQYDFRRKSTHFVTAGTAWSNPASDILGDIEAACLKIRIDGKVNPDAMLMGKTAVKSLINNTAAQKLADNRRYEFLQFGGGEGAAGVGDDLFRRRGFDAKFARFVAGGFIPRGLLISPEGWELCIFTYLDGYNDPTNSDTWTPYMPDDHVVIWASQARCDRYFGPPENLPMIPMREQLYREFFGFDPLAPPMPANTREEGGIILPEACYHDAYVSADWKRLTIRMQCAPIYATTMTDAFVTIDTEP